MTLGPCLACLAEQEPGRPCALQASCSKAAAPGWRIFGAHLFQGLKMPAVVPTQPRAGLHSPSKVWASNPVWLIQRRPGGEHSSSGTKSCWLLHWGAGPYTSPVSTRVPREAGVKGKGFRQQTAQG